MARTIDTVYNEIVTEAQNYDELNAIDTTSRVSRFHLLIYIVAVAIVIFEKILDQHIVEVDEIIFEQKIGTDRWHRNKALDFQYGFDLLEDDDQFDNGTATDDEIADSKIIKHAAVVQSETRSSIIIKVATENNEVLEPITDEQLVAFTAYMEEVSFAGTQFTVINEQADLLVPSIRIYRDPLVLNETGQNILTGEQSVEIAITNYLKELNFNGELIIQSLVDALQLVDGVQVVHVTSLQTAQYSSGLGAYEDVSPISVRHTAYSGHFKVEDFSGMSYVV